MPAKKNDAPFALVRKVEKAHIQVLEDDAEVRDAPYRQIEFVRLYAVLGARSSAAVFGCGLQDGLHFGGPLAQGIPVERYFVQDLTQGGQEGVRFFDGEEPLEGGVHAWGRLAAYGQAVCEHVGEARRPYLGLGLPYVVLDKAVVHRLAVGDHVRGEGVPVAWLAHGTRVHQVGSAGPEIQGMFPQHRPVRGGGYGLHVRVAEKADRYFGILALQQGEIVLGRGRVDDVLVGISHRAVDEERLVAQHHTRPRAQEVGVLLAQVIPRPQYGRSRRRVEPVEVRLRVRYGEVMVTRDRRHNHRAHHVAALVGVRPVADNVAEAVDGLYVPGHVGEDGFQSLEVAVDVRDHRVHNRVRRSLSFGCTISIVPTIR